MDGEICVKSYVYNICDMICNGVCDFDAEGN